MLYVFTHYLIALLCVMICVLGICYVLRIRMLSVSTTSKTIYTLNKATLGNTVLVTGR